MACYLMMPEDEMYYGRCLYVGKLILWNYWEIHLISLWNYAFGEPHKESQGVYFCLKVKILEKDSTFALTGTQKFVGILTASYITRKMNGIPKSK